MPQPNTWGVPGGSFESHERIISRDKLNNHTVEERWTARKATAVREVLEECGSLPRGLGAGQRRHGPRDRCAWCIQPQRKDGSYEHTFYYLYLLTEERDGIGGLGAGEGQGDATCGMLVDQEGREWVPRATPEFRFEVDEGYSDTIYGYRWFPLLPQTNSLSTSLVKSKPVTGHSGEESRSNRRLEGEESGGKSGTGTTEVDEKEEVRGEEPLEGLPWNNMTFWLRSFLLHHWSDIFFCSLLSNPFLPMFYFLFFYLRVRCQCFTKNTTRDTQMHSSALHFFSLSVCLGNSSSFFLFRLLLLTLLRRDAVMRGLHELERATAADVLEHGPKEEVTPKSGTRGSRSVGGEPDEKQESGELKPFVLAGEVDPLELVERQVTRKGGGGRGRNGPKRKRAGVRASQEENPRGQKGRGGGTEEEEQRDTESIAEARKLRRQAKKQRKKEAKEAKRRLELARQAKERAKELGKKGSDL